MATASSPIIVEGLTKRYGHLTVVNSVDLEVRSGEFVTLLGPSGSGKTSLLMMMAGFARPDGGRVMFGRRDVTHVAPQHRGIGVVFQGYALFPNMTVAGNLAFPLEIRGVGRAERDDRVRRALDLVQLQGMEERRIDQLSGGQRQRVALARATIFEPGILLLDEPLSALDKKLREHMQIELRRLHERLGLTAICVTHDQREALSMSDRIAVIDKGRIQQFDTPEQLYDAPANHFVADFLGESSVLPATVSGGTATAAGTRLRLHQTPADGNYLLVLRPERLRLLAADGGSDAANVFHGRAEQVVYQGDSILMEARLQDGSLVTLREAARAGPGTRLERGAELRAAVAPEDLILVRAP